MPHATRLLAWSRYGPASDSAGRDHARRRNSKSLCALKAAQSITYTPRAKELLRPGEELPETLPCIRSTRPQGLAWTATLAGWVTMPHGQSLLALDQETDCLIEPSRFPVVRSLWPVPVLVRKL